MHKTSFGNPTIKTRAFVLSRGYIPSLMRFHFLRFLKISHPRQYRIRRNVVHWEKLNSLLKRNFLLKLSYCICNLTLCLLKINIFQNWLLKSERAPLFMLITQWFAFSSGKSEIMGSMPIGIHPLSGMANPTD